MVSNSLSVPILTVEPPTPIPTLSPRHSDFFGSSLPIPFLDTLDLLNPSETIFEEEKIDFNLLSPPGPSRRRRRSLSRKSSSPKPTSFVGLSLLGIATIILFTSIASFTLPLRFSGHGLERGESFSQRFRGKMHVAMALEVQGGAMLRDMTLGDIWSSVTHRESPAEDIEVREQRGSRDGRPVRAMSNDAWIAYREKRSKVASAAGLDLWDFH